MKCWSAMRSTEAAWELARSVVHVTAPLKEFWQNVTAAVGVAEVSYSVSRSVIQSLYSVWDDESSGHARTDELSQREVVAENVNVYVLVASNDLKNCGFVVRSGLVLWLEELWRKKSAKWMLNKQLFFSWILICKAFQAIKSLGKDIINLKLCTFCI